MDLSSALADFVTLFVVIDPIGTTSIFIALTSGVDRATHRAIAIRSVAISAGILMFFGLSGEWLLQAIGISIPAFRIAGGLLLFLTAIEMLLQRRNSRRSNTASADGERDDPTVYPLAFPLIAGPGSITTMILLAGNTEGQPDRIAILAGTLLAVLLLVLALFWAARWIERWTSQTLIDVFTRLLGMLLAALSIQFVLDGISAFFEI